MMRGKIECQDSVIKRVSNNLIVAKRNRPKYEFYLNAERLAEYNRRKQAQLAGTEEEARTDFGLSKAYRLLPNYHAKDDEPDKGFERETAADANKRKLHQWQESLKTMATGPKFTTPELEYMNNPPPYQYLTIKDPLMRENNKQRKKPLSTRGDLRAKLKNMPLRDYIGAEHFRYSDMIA